MNKNIQKFNGKAPNTNNFVKSLQDVTALNTQVHLHFTQKFIKTSRSLFTQNKSQKFIHTRPQLSRKSNIEDHEEAQQPVKLFTFAFYSTLISIHKETKICLQKDYMKRGKKSFPKAFNLIKFKFVQIVGLVYVLFVSSWLVCP